jgi:hypothetical protein
MSWKATTVGIVTTYVITDAEGATGTLVLTNNYGSGRLLTLASTGTGLHQDGQLQLATLMNMLSTGLTPGSSNP